MNVVYLTSVRYPTDKAYGVTMKYTLDALIKLGHRTSVLDVDELTYNQTNEFILSIFLKLHLFIQNICVGFPRLQFRLKQLILAFVCVSKGVKGVDLIWTREPIFTFVLSILGRSHCYVVEIHNNFGYLDKLFLKLTQLRSKLILAPISPYLYKEIARSNFQFKRHLITLCPMGVPDFFYSEHGTLYRSRSECESQITYSGGLRSIGVDNGVTDLILSFASLCRHNPFEFNFGWDRSGRDPNTKV
jgi:hypothetical protein